MPCRGGPLCPNLTSPHLGLSTLPLDCLFQPAFSCLSTFVLSQSLLSTPYALSNSNPIATFPSKSGIPQSTSPVRFSSFIGQLKTRRHLSNVHSRPPPQSTLQPLFASFPPPSSFNQHTLALIPNPTTTLSFHDHTFATMQTKTLLLALATSLFSLASAQSAPGCLLGAVNSYPDPANISAICKSSDAPAKIAQFCPDLGERDAALKAFKDICAAQGVQVCKWISLTVDRRSQEGGFPELLRPRC